VTGLTHVRRALNLLVMAGLPALKRAGPGARPAAALHRLPGRRAPAGGAGRGSAGKWSLSKKSAGDPRSVTSS
jgi:hypothetical protein